MEIKVQSISIILFFLLGATCLFSQFDQLSKISTEENGKSILDWKLEYEKKNQIDIIFEDKSVEKKIISGLKEVQTLPNFIKSLVSDQKIVILGNKIYLVVNEKDNDFEYIDVFSQPKKPVKGIVIDGETNEEIIGASVKFLLSNDGTISNEKGVFENEVQYEITPIEISYVGYQTRKIKLVSSLLSSNKVLNIKLNVFSDELETIYVVAKKSDDNIRSQVTGIQQLNIEAIKQMPTFMGEIDPIKSITTLPGVSSMGDIGAGFIVRGGENNQNLIFQDGAIIFNPTHLFGFFSAFNPDFINNLTLYKGGGPASFGGRVSSILDIDLRNGNLQKFKMSGAAGLTAGRVAIEGPIFKNKVSFLLGGRLSYTSWLLHYYNDKNIKKSFANFNDITGKILYQINKKNTISITGYNSYDDFNIGIDSTFGWTTKNLSAKWSHVFSQKSIANVTIANSNYSSSVLYQDEIFVGHRIHKGVDGLLDPPGAFR